MDINRYNYENFFLLYLDNELGSADMQKVERFLDENADLQREFSLLRQTVQMPADIVFEGKETLYRKEEKRRMFPLYPMRIAASVAVLLAGSLFIATRVVKKNTDEKSGIATVAPKPAGKHDAAQLNSDTENRSITGQPAQASVMLNDDSADQPKENATTGNKSLSKSIPQKGFVNQTGVSDPGIKNQRDFAAGNNREFQNLPANPELIESGIATEKSNDALELQTSVINKGPELQKITVLPEKTAPALSLAATSKDLQSGNALVAMDESEYQTENAISVFALNEKNKSITALFKKLTSRAPVDDGTKKLRISVFQISL